MISPFLVCVLTIAQNDMFHCFIILLTSGASTMIPKSTCELHPANPTKVTHMFRCPKPEHLGESRHCQIYGIPINQIKTQSWPTEIVMSCKESFHGIVMDPLQNLFYRIRGRFHIISPEAPSFKFNRIEHRSHFFGEESFDSCISMSIH
jgi:hypothetical protein